MNHDNFWKRIGLGTRSLWLRLTERPASLQDVTLRESEELFRSIIEQSGDGIVLTDERGAIIEWNRGQETITGLGKAEVLGRDLWDVQAQLASEENREPEFLRQLKASIQAFLKTGQTLWTNQLQDALVYRADGTVRNIQSVVFPIKTGKGFMAAGISRDVTAQKNTEQALRQSEDRYRAISETVSDYAFSTRVDPDGSIEIEWLTVEAYYRITGYHYDELRDDIDQLAHPDDLERFHRDHAKIMAGEATSGEYRIITKSGETRWLQIYRRPVWDDEQKRVVRFLGAARDVTERRQAQQERETLIEELENKNAELERFTYTVSHDLKSPLITIQGFLGYLEQAAREGDIAQVEQDTRRISNAVGKMQQMLGELLELSRIGRLVNAPQDIPFGKLAQEAVDMVSGELSERGIVVDIAAELPVVFGDRVRLQEVLENLISNATKFMGDQAEPRVSIGMRHDGEERVFYVQDNGMGIDPRYHDTVFGLFNKLTNQTEGTGIGLAIARRIIEVHGGRIWVESAGKGTGSTFCFWLPDRKEAQ